MKTAMLSILFILALVPCLARAQEEYVETFTIHSEASITIHEEDEATDEIITPRPSCGVVKHRLQEYYKRTAEAEYFLDWYSPEKMGVKESAALLNFLKRTPFFINERLNENVKITHKWEIPKNLYEEIPVPGIPRERKRFRSFPWFLIGTPKVPGFHRIFM